MFIYFFDPADYDPGYSVLINATCHYNGTIEVLAQGKDQSIDNIRLQYNCTGSNPQEVRNSVTFCGKRVDDKIIPPTLGYTHTHPL